MEIEQKSTKLHQIKDQLSHFRDEIGSKQLLV